MLSAARQQPTVLTQPRFAAGKVLVMADFDGTYLPAGHKDISLATSQKPLSHLDRYFSQVKRFLTQNPSDIRLKVTTGRNLAEFHSILNHLRRLGIKMPLPDSVITKNGADEYARTMPDELFYQTEPSGGKLSPFSAPNLQKRAKIREATGWDGPAIREKLLAMLLSYGFKVRQDPTTNSAGDYGEDSTLYHVQDDFNAGDNPAARSPWTAALRQDGDLGFFIGLPKDILQRRDNGFSQPTFLEAIQNILKDSLNTEAPFDMRYAQRDGDYGKRPAVTVKPVIDGLPLSKAYDTLLAIDEARAENDLVITAGDGTNDFEMLNPAYYLNLPESLKSLAADPHALKSAIERDPDLQRQFQDLPFFGVVIERDGKVPEKLKDLLTAYGEGPDAKLIKVSKGRLFEGVLHGINAYAQQHPAFGDDMSAAFKASIKRFESEGFYQPATNGWFSTAFQQLVQSARRFARILNRWVQKTIAAIAKLFKNDEKNALKTA